MWKFLTLSLWTLQIALAGIAPGPPGQQEQPVFQWGEVPGEIEERMLGASLPEEEREVLASLAYVQVTYWDYEGRTQSGELVVHKDLAQEVADIFEELYEEGFPIASVRLIDEYGGQDELSMEANNTSAFCYRKIAGSSRLSNHALGRAIDINPLQNPHVKEGEVSPPGGTAYADRAREEQGMIHEGDACYQAFTRRGWVWGGDWKNSRDYQHFEKP